MGAGASLEAGGIDGHYRCEACGRLTPIHPSSTGLCDRCRALAFHDNDPHSLIERDRDLSHRRLLSAVGVLRLIETQLHHEILLLQASLALQSEQCNAMSACRRNLLIQGLKRIDVHEELLNDKECAICASEYDCPNSDCEILQLPCLHIFHKDCVQPWLQKNLTCPVCRLTIDLSAIPSVEDLAKLSRLELAQRLSYFSSENATDVQRNKSM